MPDQRKVVDPVCGMKFFAHRARGQVERDGEIYYFCCEACREQFEAEPARFAGGA